MTLVTFSVNDEKVIANLRAMGPRIRERLRQAITREAIALTRHVKEEKLSGQVLKNRTGTLRRSINFKVTEDAAGVSGSVGTGLKYARVHEYGFNGTVSIREHLRTVKQAFGRPIEPISVTVREHARRVKLPERSFLRSSLADRLPSLRESLRAAVAGAVNT
jgi:phage gpG-like protein